MTERSRCIICGEFIHNGAKQLCDWCQDPKVEEVLKELIDDVDSQLQQVSRIDVQTNPTFSLVADLGLLGVRHPLLASFSKVIAKLINEGGKGVRRFKMNALRYGQKDIKAFIMMLHDSGLVAYDDAKDEVTVPDQSILLKIKYQLEVEPRRDPVAAFALGYVTLKSILKTVELAKQRRVEYGEGVTGLYSATRDGATGRVKIVMPKSYMATLTFVLGYWAKGITEFSELDIHRFMVDRGITGREFGEVLATLTCAFATTHALYERVSVEHLGRVSIHRFKLNEEYVKLYERIRTRERAR
jgi:hypothetical protein